MILNFPRSKLLQKCPKKFLVFRCKLSVKSSYTPKTSRPVRLKDFLKFTISRMSWGMKLTYCMWLVRHLKKKPIYKLVLNTCRKWWVKLYLILIIFWDFLIAEQIFLSPQVKRSVIVSNKLLYTRWWTG